MGCPYKYTHMGQAHTRMGKNTRTGRNSYKLRHGLLQQCPRCFQREIVLRLTSRLQYLGTASLQPYQCIPAGFFGYNLLQG